MKRHPNSHRRRYEQSSQWRVCLHDPSEETELTEENYYVTLSEEDNSEHDKDDHA